MKKSSGMQYEVRPVLPVGKDGVQKKGRYGKKPDSQIFHAHSPDAAIKQAVVKGFIPSNTVMQYYEAVPTSRR